MTRQERKNRARQKKRAITDKLTDVFSDTFESTPVNAAGFVPIKPGVRKAGRYLRKLMEERPQEASLILEACREWELAMVDVVKKVTREDEAIGKS